MLFALEIDISCLDRHLSSKLLNSRYNKPAMKLNLRRDINKYMPQMKINPSSELEVVSVECFQCDMQRFLQSGEVNPTSLIV